MVNPTTTNQLFRLDTTVNTPVISGPLFQNAGPVLNQSYDLSNIDEDVIEVFSGPSAMGVIVHDFTNNGDGTGTCLVDFSPNYIPRYLSVIAQDDVGNLSAESNILLIDLEVVAGLGVELKLYPLEPFYGTVLDGLLANMPKTEFIVSCEYLIPYTPDAYPFILEVTDTLRTVNITIVRRGFASDPTRYQYRLDTPKDTVYLKLSKGENIITFSDGYDTKSISVVTAHWATVVHGYAKEIYQTAGSSLTEQNNSIFSPMSIRLAENLIDFYNVFPNVITLRNMAGKAAVRLITNQPGTQIAVNDLVSALCGSTPFIRACVPENTVFEPVVYPMFNNAESFAGNDFHVWMANPCVAQWAAFAKYVNNFFRIVSLSEAEIVFYDDNNILKRYEFDSSTSECSLFSYLARLMCASIVADCWFISNILFAFCAAAYPHDLCFSPSHPLGLVRVYLDSGIPFDSGVPFDEFYEDPGDDGWNGFCILSHLDDGPFWDSMGPAPFDNGAEATLIGTQSGPFYITGKTLEVQVGTGAVQTFTFTGTNPISIEDVIAQINSLPIWWELPVLDKDLTAPPASPAIGSRYIVAALPTGGFTGHPYEIATKKYPINIFTQINSATGTNSVPITLTQPCNIQLIVEGGANAFDGDGNINITGVDSNGAVITEMIPVTAADAGTTIQGVATYTQLTQIDWDWGIWTKGKVDVQTAWVFKMPIAYTTAMVSDEAQLYQYNGASWNSYTAAVGPFANGFRASILPVDRLYLETTGYIPLNTLTIVGGTALPQLGFLPGDTATSGMTENLCVYASGYATVVASLASVDVDCPVPTVMSGTGTVP